LKRDIMWSLWLFALFLIGTINAQCNYTNCTDCVNDNTAGFVSCEWHSVDDYCYNWYTQPANDDDNGITSESLCPENALSAAEAAAVVIILVVLCVFCYCVLPAAIYCCCFQAFKAMLSPGARNTVYPANNPQPVVMSTQSAPTPSGMEGNPGMTTTQTSTGPVIVVPQGQSPPQQQVIYQQAPTTGYVQPGQQQVVYQQAPVQGQQQVVYQQQPQTQGQHQVVYQQQPPIQGQPQVVYQQPVQQPVVYQQAPVQQQAAPTYTASAPPSYGVAPPLYDGGGGGDGDGGDGGD